MMPPFSRVPQEVPLTFPPRAYKSCPLANTLQDPSAKWRLYAMVISFCSSVRLVDYSSVANA